jgi:hypothetical protein
MGRRAPNPVRQAKSETAVRPAPNNKEWVITMSLKNLMLAMAAAGAFVGAIVVAAGPEQRRADYAMPMYRTAK